MIIGDTNNNDKLFFLFLPILLISACGITPNLSMEDVNRTLTPATVLVDFPTSQSSKVIWGGIIVNSQNLRKGSLLEVLAYPLGFSDEPDTQKAPLGRFLTEHPEYLETVNYAAGRLITVVGPLLEIRKGVIGEAQYYYPVIAAEQLHLWPTSDPDSDTRFYFGVGVTITN